MKSIFGFDEAYLKKIKAHITAKEIRQQPRLWKETLEIITNKKEQIKKYLDEIFQEDNLRIIFTGAGTSAFVGECVTPYLDRKLLNRVEAIPTTDIVSNPENYLHSDVPTLLVSCARSGNSPESVAAVELAENLVDNLYQIFLTCNPEGSLAKKALESDKNLLILMPEDSNDQGFAMTGSFTTMILSSLLIFNLDELEDIEEDIINIANIGENLLKNRINEIMNIQSVDFDRIVYLGSSSLKGLAREAALKILELTRGKIVSDHNSSLGFRHGPKSIINDNTLVVSYLSNDKYTRQYEVDLLQEMKTDGGNTKIMAISSYKDEKVENLVDYFISIHEDKKEYRDDVFLVFNYILIAQIFAFLKSIKLGISPDNPSPDGVVNRVVKGVVIYPYHIKDAVKVL
ncbi:SIS domain-containing protein [Paramaledivibacter caminithermalis]|jgi:tagatose-6-phosphate ketose/aldose isomerase|uniref:Galactosamine 6-phosphate isomerase AgaS n=1 Tax=Paramaledivibacter caminithermalis (strain DSM 15212 / CIP 107654 / DViRD3) TaxID=1121301 RepID=A0A1M6PIQ5_PARC5|nr:SIS domain-containing protein [Paramaledivibacter caminithermalis]SHK07828.1 galactosamine 6-phosphate isomerase AgaS [Paramaledivibacter caminithermalis DSM 15212]